MVRKSTPRFTKSPRLVLIRPVLTEIQRFKNVRTLCSDSIHPRSDSARMAIHCFVNFDIFKWLYLACYWIYLHQTWGFSWTWHISANAVSFPLCPVIFSCLRRLFPYQLSKTHHTDWGFLVPPRPEMDYEDHQDMVEHSYSEACHLLQAVEMERSSLSCSGFCTPI